MLGFAAEGLTVARGGRLVLRDVTFRLDPGAALMVTGRNGTGKSTLLRALAGLLPLAGGWFGFSAESGAISASEHIHYVGHAEGLKGALTAGETLDVAAAMAGARTLSAGAALERLGLGHVLDLPVAYLSAGQRRRVALARLLMSARPLWMLDEPLNALDDGAQAMLGGLMAEHRAGGGLIVAATHAALGLAASSELRLEA